MISITDFKDIMISKAGGKPLSKVSSIYALMYQAMLEVKTNVDLPSAMRTVQLTNPIYTAIDRYAIPTDVGINAILTLRPVNPDDSFYDFTHLNQRQLKLEEKYNYGSQRYGIRTIDGVQYLVVDDITTSPVVVHNCDSLSTNGAVSLVGTATGLVIDSLQKIAGNGSISFGVGVGASNGIRITGLTSTDLSNQNDILFYAYLPSLTNVNGLTIKLGQSVSAYYQASATADMYGNALVVGWNLIRIPKTSFTVGAGVPTWTGVVFAEYDIVGTFAVAQTGFRIDNIVGQVGALFEIDYYSDYQFLTTAGARIAKPTSDTDIIMLQGDELNLFTDEFISMMTTDLKQQGSGVDEAKYAPVKFSRRGIALDKYDNFRLKFPSQRQLMTTQYANRPNLLT